MPQITKDSQILITSSNHNITKELALSAFQKFQNKGYDVYLDSFLALRREDTLPVDKNEKLDLVIVFGGDGTILKTFANWKNVPILGVNCGKIGFLTEIEPEELDTAIDKIEKNEYFFEGFNALKVSSENFPSFTAANDVIVTSDKIGQIISLRVTIDDQYLYTSDGDGMIIASCVGSSAYSLSAGGSLIVPCINALTLVPICPISRRIFPMVISSDVKLSLVNLSEYRAGHVVIDGKTYYSIGYKESIDITISDDQILFLRFSENYVKRVREKLLKFNPDDFDE